MPLPVVLSQLRPVSRRRPEACGLARAAGAYRWAWRCRQAPAPAPEALTCAFAVQMYNTGMTKRFVVDVPEDEHSRVKAAAALQGWKLSDLVRALLALWLSGKVKLSPPRRKSGK